MLGNLLLRVLCVFHWVWLTAANTVAYFQTVIAAFTLEILSVNNNIFEQDYIWLCKIKSWLYELVSTGALKMGLGKLIVFMFYCKKNKNFMAPFYGWGSTASRLQPFLLFDQYARYTLLSPVYWFQSYLMFLVQDSAWGIELSGRIKFVNNEVIIP